MVPTMTLWTFERQGEIAETVIPGISHTFMPAMIAELRRFDPDFVALPSAIKTHRTFVDEDDPMPFWGIVDANLVLVICIPGNRKLEARTDSIEKAVTHLLSNVLHPREGIYVMLVTK